MYSELSPWLNGTLVVLFARESFKMIRITRQTDYGILLLSQMAGSPLSEVHTAKNAAQQSHIPLPMASKILKALAKAGLLVSQRGVKGGYRLAASADSISLADVIQALEGPIGITECSFNPGACEQEGCCPVRTNWKRISVAVRDALDKIPLSEMTLAPIHRSDAQLFTLQPQVVRPL